MVSPVLTEHYYTGAFLVSEAPGSLSRDQATMVNGTGSDVYYDGGLVLTDSPVAVAGTNTGNGTVGSILIGSDAVAGSYVVALTSATAFTVTDPTGRLIGTGTVGTALKIIPVINLTVTAGGTAFVSGDTFTVAVLGPNGTFAPYTSTSAPASAVLFNRVRVPANSSVLVTVIARNAEVNKAELVWDSTVTGSGSVALLESEAVAGLLLSDIVCR
jgi:hypothetical protein